MSFFSNLVTQKFVISRLSAGDVTIELKFRPISVRQLSVLSSFEKSEETVETVANLCQLLADLAVENEEGQKPTVADFMELDVESLTLVINDIVASVKKNQPKSASSKVQSLGSPLDSDMNLII